MKDYGKKSRLKFDYEIFVKMVSRLAINYMHRAWRRYRQEIKLNT